MQFRVNFGLHSGGRRWFATETEAKAAIKAFKAEQRRMGELAGTTSATIRLRWSAALTESLISKRGITPDRTTKNEHMVFVFHKISSLARAMLKPHTRMYNSRNQSAPTVTIVD